MKKYVILLICVILNTSCSGQEDSKIRKGNISILKEAPYNFSDDGDGSKFNYDDLSRDFINKAKKTLEQRRFQFPSEDIFDLEVSEIFGFNLKDYKNTIVALQPSMFPEIAIRKDRFIFLQDSSADEPDFINPDLIYHYNSYIFYKTPVSYIWLQANEPDVLFNLVTHYGYNSDKKLVENVFKKFDFNSLSNVEELIFSDSHSRKKLKKQIFDDIETIIYKGKVEDFSYAKEGNGYLRIGEIIEKISNFPNDYIDPEKTIAYLFERELRVGIQGDIESYMNKNPNYKSFLDKNKFYELPTLKDYVEYIYQKENDYEIFIIQDPDGYTNLRKDKNTSSEIIQKIESGEKIEILDKNGDWYLVQTKEGKKGYVHKSKVK